MDLFRRRDNKAILDLERGGSERRGRSNRRRSGTFSNPSTPSPTPIHTSHALTMHPFKQTFFQFDGNGNFKSSQREWDWNVAERTGKEFSWCCIELPHQINLSKSVQNLLNLVTTSSPLTQNDIPLMVSHGPFCEEIDGDIVFRVNAPGQISHNLSISSFKIGVRVSERSVIAVSMGCIPRLCFSHDGLDSPIPIEWIITDEVVEKKSYEGNCPVPNSIPNLVVHIVSRYIDHIQNVAREFEIELNSAELDLDTGGYALKKECVDNRQFPKMHTDLLRLLQVIVHGEQVFSRLMEKCSVKDWFAREDLTALQRLLGHLNGLKNNVDLMVSRVTAIQSGLDTWQAERIKTKLYKFSLVSIIFLLSLIIGVIGMNVGGHPWTGQESSKQGFLMVILVSAVCLLLFFYQPFIGF